MVDEVEIQINGIPYKTIIDEEGVQRFPQNGLHKHLVDTNQVDLDRLGSDFQEGKFTLEEYAGFYRGIGYSVCSYMDIFE